MNRLDTIAKFNDLDPYPELIEGVDVDLAIKNSLLFTVIDDEIYAILKEEKLIDGLNFLSKLSIFILERQFDISNLFKLISLTITNKATTFKNSKLVFTFSST